MLVEIENLLDERKCGIIAIECEGLCSPAFLHLSIIDYAVKRNIKVIYMSGMRSFYAFRVMASRLMLRQSEKLKFLPLYQFLLDDLITDDDSFCTRILEEIDNHLEENDQEVFFVCDNFTAFCDLINSNSHAVAFIRHLQQLFSKKDVEARLVLTFQWNDQISNIVLHESDMLIKIKHIGNGFAKDITGQLLIVERRGEPPYKESIFNYHLTDRFIRLSLPGMSRPEL